MPAALASSKIYHPITLSPSLTLSHRLVLAPLTRQRASDEHTPLDFVPEYYAQRASYPGTLLISEGTIVDPLVGGYPNVPCLYTEEARAAWRTVTDKVHKAGSKIFCQLWGIGRVAPIASYAKDNGLDVETAKPVGPSPLAAAEDHVVPRELSIDELRKLEAAYGQAARWAVESGFDGVEVHGANGYIVDAMTQDKSNVRTDIYGGSVENRARFGLNVAKACVDAIGADKVGYRISPYSTFQGMRMDDPVPTFKYLVQGLRELGLVYLHVVEPRIAGAKEAAETNKHDSVRWIVETWGKDRAVILAGGFDGESARQTLEESYEDYENVLVAIGRHWIPNPDLVYRYKHGVDVTKYDRSTFYKVKSKDGYVDWEFSREFKESQEGRKFIEESRL